MAPYSLGVVAVVSPGTAVPLALESVPCAGIRVQYIYGQIDDVYFGTRSVNHVTRAGAVKWLVSVAAGVLGDSYEVWCAGGNQLNLADYAIDSATAGHGVLVSYWVA